MRSERNWGMAKAPSHKIDRVTIVVGMYQDRRSSLNQQQKRRRRTGAWRKEDLFVVKVSVIATSIRKELKKWEGSTMRAVSK